MSFSLTPDTWKIYGTGYTTWSGTTEKIGAGTRGHHTLTGTPVSVNANTLLKITGGTFEAGGTADPFTDTTTNLSLDIVNNSTAPGLLISQGVKNVGDISGTGDTTISGPAGTELIVDSFYQTNLNMGVGCILSIRQIPGGYTASSTSITPVPEPATWILLVLAGVTFFTYRKCRRPYRP